MTGSPDHYDASSLLRSIQTGGSLSEVDTTSLFEAMMSGQVDDIQIAGALSLLATRPPTVDELTAAAGVMRRHVTAIPTDVDDILDTAGTGGAPKTFNVSTAAAIVAAACDIPVAKHGNRSRTGRGSAEVLQDLGVNIDASPEAQARCLESAGVCFCFAIHHHPATRFVVPIRKSLTFPTIFNLLGPLTNPAGAARQLLGVWDARFGRLMAETLHRLGSREAMIAHSEDGLDELSISAPTTIWHLRDGEIDQLEISPEDVGLSRHPMEAVTARDLTHATEIIRRVLHGEEHGPCLDMVLLNAAAAVVVGGAAASMEEGVERSRSAVSSGRAAACMGQLCEISHRPTN